MEGDDLVHPRRIQAVLELGVVGDHSHGTDVRAQLAKLDDVFQGHTLFVIDGNFAVGLGVESYRAVDLDVGVGEEARTLDRLGVHVALPALPAAPVLRKMRDKEDIVHSMVDPEVVG